MAFPDGIPRWRRYLRFLRPNVRGDVDDELRFHFESRIEELIAQGVPPAQARDSALREFGDVQDVREHLVSIGHRLAERRRHAEMLQDIVADARYAIRSLLRTPGAAFAILATLALGVGANTAMFSVLDAVFLRPPAGVIDPGGVRRLWVMHHFSDGVQFWPGFSYAEYDAIRSAVGRDAAMTIYSGPNAIKIGPGESNEKAQVSRANSDFFTLSGARVEIGRPFASDEERLDAPKRVAVISHRYWQRTFGGDDAVLGKTIALGPNKFTIVGVMAEPFTGVEMDAADVWLPLAFEAEGRSDGMSWWKSPNVNAFQVLLRPRAGANDTQLEERITAALRHPDFGFYSDSVAVARFGSIIRANGPGKKGQEVQIAIRLAGVTIVVLLIACANVVNLLLARAVRRRREIAVRLTLGITRARLVRLLLTETAVLALAAAVAALFVAYVGGGMLRRLLLPDVHWAASAVDWRVGAFALFAAITAGVLAGLVPALQSASADVTHALKSGSTGAGATRSRLRMALVAAQAALSVVLLIGAALFVRSLSNVRQLDLGYDAARFVTASVDFDDHSKTKEPEFAARLGLVAERMRAIPGVAHVALATARPIYSISWLDPFYTDTDSSRRGFSPTFFGVSRGYFDAAGIRLVRGQDFPLGAEAAYTIVINREMAHRAWPARDPVGQCVYFGARATPCYHVIGVVENARERSLIEEPQPMYFLPVDHLPPVAKGWSANFIAIRVDPERLASAVGTTRSLLRQEFPAGIPSIVRLSDYLAPQYRPWRLGATLFSSFGLLALLVAIVGIYSTTSYNVQQRTHEFGVRIAVGAGFGDVLRLVISEGVLVIALGVLCGVGLALVAGRLVASLLYGVKPSDPATAIVIGLTLMLVAICAALAPAWRAARVDPVIALRAD
jgi:putative ABC transport system permease protein